MVKKSLGILAGLLLLAGCSNNDFTDNGAIVPDGQLSTINSITATMDAADTRVVLDKNQVLWEDQEHVYVFSNTETTDVHDYEMAGLDSKLNAAQFSGDEISGSEFYAFYPQPLEVDFSAKEATVHWVYDKIYEQVNYQCKIPMFAKSTTANMQFKQLGGILHFQICGQGILKCLTLTGNNGEKFYQNFKLKYTADEIKLEPASISEGVNTSITAYIEPTKDGMYQYLNELVPFDVYFVLPAGMTFEKGFTLSGIVTVGDPATDVPFEQKTTESFTVSRAGMADFPAFNANTGGEVSAVGWKSNFCNLSGKNVGVSYYYSNDKSKVWWDIVFLTEEKADPIYITVSKDNTGAAPSLADLDGALITDLRMHDFANEHIYRTNSNVTLAVSQATDGNWSLSVTDMTIYENNGAAPNQTGIYIKYNGGVNVEPPATWHFSGAAYMSGAYAVVDRDIEKAGGHSQTGVNHERDFVRWRLRFLNFPWGEGNYIPDSFKEVVIIWEEEHDGVLPDFPTDATITGFWMDIMPEGYNMDKTYVMDDSSALLKIYKNDDGAYEINVESAKMFSGASGDPITSSFSFNGVLTDGTAN
ncbi:MAG: hypothetical protein IJT46_01380 [Bacteroidaceae bacterium]|nr:hypothetical protein [Bacteroidaceae bacterium]